MLRLLKAELRLGEKTHQELAALMEIGADNPREMGFSENSTVFETGIEFIDGNAFWFEIQAGTKEFQVCPSFMRKADRNGYERFSMDAERRILGEWEFRVKDCLYLVDVII